MHHPISTSEILDFVQTVLTSMEARDYDCLHDVFVSENAILVDSFFPYIFEGEGAVARSATAFSNHAKNLTNLKHSCGEPQEFSQKDQFAFCSVPVTWEGLCCGEAFHETGGLVLVFQNHQGKWKIRNYAWAATSFSKVQIIRP